jgi:predicted RNA binding protein YcfA (HicA-like mRNA interferase family)
MGQLGSIHWVKFEKFLLQEGCVFKREKGDHRIYSKNGLKRPIVIPRDRSLPPFVVKNNLRLLGIDTAKFLERISRI